MNNNKKMKKQNKKAGQKESDVKSITKEFQKFVEMESISMLVKAITQITILKSTRCYS